MIWRWGCGGIYAQLVPDTTSFILWCCNKKPFLLWKKCISKAGNLCRKIYFICVLVSNKKWNPVYIWWTHTFLFYTISWSTCKQVSAACLSKFVWTIRREIKTGYISFKVNDIKRIKGNNNLITLLKKITSLHIHLATQWCHSSCLSLVLLGFTHRTINDLVTNKK